MFNFRILTSKEVLPTIDNLDISKSQDPGFVYVWALKPENTHFQFIIIDCIQKPIFPKILKHSNVTPIHTKAQPHK